MLLCLKLKSQILRHHYVTLLKSQMFGHLCYTIKEPDVWASTYVALLKARCLGIYVTLLKNQMFGHLCYTTKEQDVRASMVHY